MQPVTALPAAAIGGVSDWSLAGGVYRIEAGEPPSCDGPRAGHDPSDGLEVGVRRMRLADWPVLQRVVVQMFPEVASETVGHWLRNGSHAMLVAEVGGEFAGFCHLRVRRQGAVLWVNYLGAMPQLQPHGVAQKLLQHAERCAAEWGCMRVELDVLSRNGHVVSLYDHTGYRCVTTLTDSQGRLKYRYRKEIRFGRLDHLSAPPGPPSWQRAFLRLLYETWITGPSRARAWWQKRAGTPRVSQEQEAAEER